MTSEYVKTLIDKAYAEQASFLDLGNCGLTEVPEEIVILAPWLKKLNFGPWYISDEKYVYSKNSGERSRISDSDSWMLLQKLLGLTNLYIGSNSIGDKGAESLSRLTGLTNLYIGSNSIGDKGAESLSRLTGLTNLDIWNNSIGDKGAESLSRLTGLTNLDIWNNSIGDKGAESLSRLTGLTNLDIGSNSIGDKGAESLSRLTGLTNLNIRSNSIGDKGAESLSRLTGLTNLNIGSNSIGDKGAESLSRLTGLTNLDIDSNSIGDKGAESLSRLTGLTNLDIGSNSIGDKGAESLSRLTGLTNLDILSNSIGDKGAESLSRLTGLTNLNIGLNSIGEKGAASLSRLTGLTNLEISYNSIGEKGAESLSRLTGLKSLQISNNKIRNIETIERLVNALVNVNEIYLGKTDTLPKGISNDINALRRYFLTNEKVDDILVKLILVGNGAAGKSSLADYLATGNFITDRPPTYGIKVWKWKFKHNDTGVHVNIWDFGGQDYFHATHNIFLKERSLFLLLHTSEEIHKRQARNKSDQWFTPQYWLANIADISDSEYVVWSVRTNAEIGRTAAIDDKLKNRFRVSEDFRISVKKAYDASQNNDTDIDFDFFKKKLSDEILTRTTQRPLEVWVYIRDKILADSEGAVFLLLKDFQQQCMEYVSGNKVREENLLNNFEGLIKYLNATGVTLQFTDSAELEDYIFLSADRLTSRIYETVLNGSVIDNNGIFYSDRVPPEERELTDIFIKVLKEYGLVFESGPNTIVVPQYLPGSDFETILKEDYPLRLIIRFPDYMSRSMMSRVVTRYALSDRDSKYWKDCVMFKLNGLRTIVRFDSSEQKIYIHIRQGDPKLIFENCKDIFLFVAGKPVMDDDAPRHIWVKGMEYFDKFFRFDNRIEKYMVQAALELSVNGVDFVTVREVKTVQEDNINKLKSVNDKTIEPVPLFNFLLQESVSYKKRIGIVYGNGDAGYAEKLSSHLYFLINTGTIETWDIGKVIAGSNELENLEDLVLTTDYLVLMISSELANQEKMIKKIQELSMKSDSRFKIVFVLVNPWAYESIQFPDKRIASILPANGKWITGAEYTNTEFAFQEVERGLKKLIG